MVVKEILRHSNSVGLERDWKTASQGDPDTGGQHSTSEEHSRASGRSAVMCTARHFWDITTPHKIICHKTDMLEGP